MKIRLITILITIIFILQSCSSYESYSYSIDDEYQTGVFLLLINGENITLRHSYSVGYLGNSVVARNQWEYLQRSSNFFHIEKKYKNCNGKLFEIERDKTNDKYKIFVAKYYKCGRLDTFLYDISKDKYIYEYTASNGKKITNTYKRNSKYDNASIEIEENNTDEQLIKNEKRILKILQKQKDKTIKKNKVEQSHQNNDGTYRNAEINKSFYIINVKGASSEQEAKNEVQKLKEKGYESNYLWIPDYASLSDAQLFSVYIGPFKTQKECEVAVEKYREKNPSAYGLLVSHNKKRVEIRGLGKVKVINR